MYIYRHHTADDVIDLDDRTGLWAPVPENADGPIFVGSMSIVLRSDFEIRGSYAIENDRRNCFYWTDDQNLVFRTHDNKRLALFRRESDGRLVDLMLQVRAELQPAAHGDGRLIANMSTFRLIDAGGHKLFEISYDSERYLQYYLGNFTFVPDEDLGDWDFFVSVKRAVEELKIIARACAVTTHSDLKAAASAADVIIAETGTASPRDGIWVACHDLNIRCRLSLGDKIPDVEGGHDTWVWIGADSR